MKSVLVVVGLVVLLVLVHLPIPEISFLRFRQAPIGVVFCFAFTVSILQMAGEYWLVGQAGRRIYAALRNALGDWLSTSSTFQQVNNFRRRVLPDWTEMMHRLMPVLKTGGYGAICGFSFISRITSVTLWRTTKLKGAGWLIVVCSLIRLLLVALTAEALLN